MLTFNFCHRVYGFLKSSQKKKQHGEVTMQKALMTFVSSSYLLAGIRLKARLMRGFQYSINCTLNTYTQMENSLSGTLRSLSLSLAHTSKHTCRHMHTLHTQPNDRDLGTSLVYDTFSRCYLTQNRMPAGLLICNPTNLHLKLQIAASCLNFCCCRQFNGASNHMTDKLEMVTLQVLSNDGL